MLLYAGRKSLPDIRGERAGLMGPGVEMNADQFARGYYLAERPSLHRVREADGLFLDFEQPGPDLEDVPRKDLVLVLRPLVYRRHALAVSLHIFRRDPELGKECPGRLVEHGRVVLDVHVPHVVDLLRIHRAQIRQGQEMNPSPSLFAQLLNAFRTGRVFRPLDRVTFQRRLAGRLLRSEPPRGLA